MEKQVRVRGAEHCNHHSPAATPAVWLEDVEEVDVVAVQHIKAHVLVADVHAPGVGWRSFSHVVISQFHHALRFDVTWSLAAESHGHPKQNLEDTQNAILISWGCTTKKKCSGIKKKPAWQRETTPTRTSPNKNVRKSRQIWRKSQNLVRRT
jgi:hypothetical protein